MSSRPRVSTLLCINPTTGAYVAEINPTTLATQASVAGLTTSAAIYTSSSSSTPYALTSTNAATPTLNKALVTYNSSSKLAEWVQEVNVATHSDQLSLATVVLTITPSAGTFTSANQIFTFGGVSVFTQPTSGTPTYVYDPFVQSIAISSGKIVATISYQPADGVTPHVIQTSLKGLST